MVVATSTAPDDDVLERSVREYTPPRMPVHCYRGSLDDVLARFSGAAESEGLDLIVRITADCPLIDPEVVDRVIALYQDQPCDYASNVRFRRTFPRGLDTEVLSRDCLERMDRLASTKAHREHVTSCIDDHRDAFVHRCLENDRDLSHLRWTLDTPEDYRLIQLLYRHLYDSDRIFPFEEAARLCERKPELMKIVADVKQKPPDRAG